MTLLLAPTGSMQEVSVESGFGRVHAVGQQGLTKQFQTSSLARAADCGSRI
ncbi:hypothetical protein [Rhizobium tropici]|uniref:hypothetical protein n=1 Tax=Rhizobium tropici TaxID=398 RepID=UPI00165F4E21|nr:hypothetical protein [Rhizobium tropici]